MPGPEFFKSRSFKYGTIAGVTSLIAGSGGAVGLAYKVAAICSSEAKKIAIELNQTIIVPTVTAIVSFDNSKRNETVSVSGIEIKLPPSLVNAVDHTSLPNDCFDATLLIGMLCTLALSVGVASLVGLIVLRLDQKTDFYIPAPDLDSDSPVYQFDF